MVITERHLNMLVLVVMSLILISCAPDRQNSSAPSQEVAVQGVVSLEQQDEVYQDQDGQVVLIRDDVSPQDVDYDTLDVASDEIEDLYTEDMSVEDEGAEVEDSFVMAKKKVRSKSTRGKRKTKNSKKVLKKKVVSKTQSPRVSDTSRPVTSAGVVRIVISLSTQKMNVFVGGVYKYTWSVATGKPGKSTTRGTFTPFLMDANYRSREFKVILPYGIKFEGSRGLLIHATRGTVGTAKSNGCVRLAMGNAKTLFSLVKDHGMKNTQIVVM